MYSHEVYRRVSLRNSPKKRHSNRNSGKENSRKHRRVKDANCSRERNRNGSLLRKRDYSLAGAQMIREEQTSHQSIEQSSPFPTYNNNNATDLRSQDKNRHNLSIMPAYSNETLDRMTSSSAVSMPTNLEMVKTSNFKVNSKKIYCNSPKDDITTKQSNAIMNQNSPVPVSSGGQVAQASHLNVNSCSLMDGIENCPQFHIIAPQAINFTSPVKNIIQLTNNVLYPPNPNTPHYIGAKPVGCKTIFVSGLPENASKEVIMEIFELCGTIKTLTCEEFLCRIQFCDELSAEKAIYFSGYRFKIENEDGISSSYRLHVNYSPERKDVHKENDIKVYVNKDGISSYRLHVNSSPERKDVHKENDMKDYVHKQQTLQQAETERHYAPYTEKEASRICEKLKSKDTFSQAAHVLISWLETGECTKEKAGRFYSMLQSIQSHFKKLQDDKVKYEEILNKSKSQVNKQMDVNIQKITEIETIYDVAFNKKCWNNFSWDQKRNIVIWRKQIKEIKSAHLKEGHLEEIINEQEDSVVLLSDDNNDVAHVKNQYKKKRDYAILLSDNDNDVTQVKSQYEKKRDVILLSDNDVAQVKNQYEKNIQEETNSLKHQLEAAQKELKAVRAEQEELKKKYNQLLPIQTTLQNSMKEVKDVTQKYLEAQTALQNSKKEVKDLNKKLKDLNKKLKDLNNSVAQTELKELPPFTSSINSENDVRLVSLISTFLVVQPFGATIDCIWSYLHDMDSVSITDVEKLMKRFPILFKEEISGTESSLEKMWKFTGFQTFITLS